MRARAELLLLLALVGCGHELGPDVWQLVDACAEQVDALTTRDLGVQAIFLRDLREHHQFLGRDLTARDTRHDRIRAAALDVREEAIIGVLECVVIQDHVVVLAREDRRDRGLTDLTTVAAPDLVDDGHAKERGEQVHCSENHRLHGAGVLVEASHRKDLIGVIPKRVDAAELVEHRHGDGEELYELVRPARQ